MRQQVIVEEIGDRPLAGVQPGADIQRLVVGIVLEIIGEAVVAGCRRVVQPVPLDGEFQQRRGILQRMLQLLISLRRQRGVARHAERCHGGRDGVELALHIRAVARLNGGTQFCQAGVLEHCLGITLQPLHRGQPAALSGQHELVIALPFGGEIGCGLVLAVGIGGPDMRDTAPEHGVGDGQRGGDGIAKQPRHGAGTGGGRGRGGCRGGTGGARGGREVGRCIDLGEHGRVQRTSGVAERVFGVAVLVELLELAVLRDHREGQVRYHDVVEKIGQRVLIVVQPAADIERGAVDVVLEIIGVAIVFGHRGAVQPVPLHGQFLKHRIGLHRPADGQVVLRGQRGGAGDARLGHGAGDGVDFALHVLTVAFLDGGAQFRQAGVLEHRLGVAFQPLDRRERAGEAVDHFGVQALPFGGEVGGRVEQSVGVGGPYMGRDAAAGDARERARNGVAKERHDLDGAAVAHVVSRSLARSVDFNVLRPGARFGMLRWPGRFRKE